MCVWTSTDSARQARQLGRLLKQMRPRLPPLGLGPHQLMIGPAVQQWLLELIAEVLRLCIEVEVAAEQQYSPCLSHTLCQTYVHIQTTHGRAWSVSLLYAAPRSVCQPAASVTAIISASAYATFSYTSSILKPRDLGHVSVCTYGEEPAAAAEPENTHGELVLQTGNSACIEECG